MNNEKQIEWNINNYVTVELCDYGVEVYKKHLRDLYSLISKTGNIEEIVDKKITELHINKRVLQLQGWDMMCIFGEYLRLGSQPIFKECIWKVEVEE